MSSSLLLGKKFTAGESRAFRMGVKNPRETESVAFVLNVQNACLSTSGDYERYYEYGGKRYSHILSKATGKPCEENIMSVSAVVPLSGNSAVGGAAKEGAGTENGGVAKGAGAGICGLISNVGTENGDTYAQNENTGAAIRFPGALSDAFSTALSALPLKEGEALTEACGVSALVVGADYRYYVFGDLAVETAGKSSLYTFSAARPEKIEPKALPAKRNIGKVLAYTAALCLAAGFCFYAFFLNKKADKVPEKRYTSHKIRDGIALSAHKDAPQDASATSGKEVPQEGFSSVESGAKPQDQLKNSQTEDDRRDGSVEK